MRTLLTMERIRNGKILERRSDNSRSFVKGLMQLLYVAHAQILQTSPYDSADITGSLRSIDSDGYYDTKGTLRVSSPSGLGGLFIPTGGYGGGSSNYAPAQYPLHYLPGHAVGIVVGIAPTAPTPTDYGMLQAIFNGRGGALAGGSVFDSYTVGDDTNPVTSYGADRYGGPLFVAARGFRLSSIRLKMYRTGNPGTLTVSIRGLRPIGYADWTSEQNAIVSGTTDGNSLTNISPGEWREIVFPSSIDIYPGIPYCMDVRAPSGDASNLVAVRGKNSVNHARYGYFLRNASSYYFNTSTVCLFEAKGSANPELEYGACEIFGLAVANPNGQFSIRRLFTNNSGAVVTVNECGIYAAATRYVAYYAGSQSYSHCIARDQVSPGVTVNPGEVLAVTYTPQITV